MAIVVCAHCGKKEERSVAFRKHTTDGQWCMSGGLNWCFECRPFMPWDLQPAGGWKNEELPKR